MVLRWDGMIDKKELQIGDRIYHRGLKQEGTFDEICAALEAMNPDPSSVFIQFGSDPDPKEVSLPLCEVKDEKLPEVCQMCFKDLDEEEFNICTQCARKIQGKLGANYG